MKKVKLSRIARYLRAIDEDMVEEYHRERGRF